MKASKYFKPYTESGKCTLNASFRTKGGVYIFRKNGVIKYIGYSGKNLYKTMYRHFQKWEDSQYRAVFKKNEVEVRIIETTEQQAPRVERFLIRKFKPEFNIMEHEEEKENDEKEIKISEIKPLTEKELLAHSVWAEIAAMTTTEKNIDKPKFKRK